MNTVKHIPLIIDGKDYILDLVDRDGDDLVAIKSICRAVGINDATQARRISGDPRFSYSHMTATGSDGKRYKMFCIPVEQVSDWATPTVAN